MKKKYLEKEDFTSLKELIKTSTKKYPNEKAFIIKHKNNKEVTYENITYRKFSSDINALGTALIKKGFKNKRIAVIGKNSYEWALTYFSIQCGVGVIVPLDKGLPIDEIEYSLKKSKTDLVIFDDEYIETMNTIKEKNSTNISTYICMRENSQNYTTVKELIKIGNKELNKGNKAFTDAKINPDEMSLILFTSGTTSLAKAVMLTQTNILVSVNAVSKIIDVTPKDVNLAILPFHHTFGALSLMYFLAGGSCNVFCDGLRYIQDNLKEYHVTAFICVPLLLESMHKKIMHQIEKQGKTKTVKFGLALSKFLLLFGIDIRRKLFKDIIDNLGGLRMAISGASALDPKVQKAFNDFGIRTSQGYGLTETAPVLTGPSANMDKCGSCGTPIPKVEVKINNPDEKGIGEIIARGPNVMLGYYEDIEATNEVIKDGWFYTGDLGYMDKDEFFFITGRKKNVIVLKNGKNIFPEELEVLLSKLPYVNESMVFGYPKGDDLLVSVKIVYNSKLLGDNLDEDKIKEIIWQDIKNINKDLPTYKHIKNLIITEEPMIKTTTAKIKRNEEMKKILGG